MTGLPPPETWSCRPLFAKPNANACGGYFHVEDCTTKSGCPLGKVVAFESELFQGNILMRVRDLKTSADVEDDKGYFNGRKRTNQVVIQGMFQTETRMRNVVFGGEYNQPYKMTPPGWFEKIMLAIFRKINPTLRMKMTGNNPFVLGDLVGGFQVIRADVPGQEPNIRSHDLQENNAAFGGGGDKTNFPMDSKSRKKFFGKVSKQANDMVFDTKTMYTFEAYDNLFNFKDYQFIIAGRTIDMLTVMSMPFQVMAKDVEKNQYLWCFEMWHEKLVLSSK